MSSLGFTRGQGASAVQPLQRAWTQAIEGQLQSDEDRLEALREVHVATVDGIRSALRIPVLVALVCVAICAASALAVVGFKIAEVLGG